MVGAAIGQWERELRDLGFENEGASQRGRNEGAADVGAGGGEGRAGWLECLLQPPREGEKPANWSAAANGKAGWSRGGSGFWEAPPFGSAGLRRSQARVRWSWAGGRLWGRGAARRGERPLAGGGGHQLREQVVYAEVGRWPPAGERAGGGSDPPRPDAAVSTRARCTCRASPRQPSLSAQPSRALPAAAVGGGGPPSSAESHEQ